MKRIIYTLIFLLLTTSMQALQDASVQQQEMQDSVTQDSVTQDTETQDTETQDSAATAAVQEKERPLVYVFDIKEMIAAPVWRTAQMAFSEADSLGADLVIIDMNTYGGEVSAA